MGHIKEKLNNEIVNLPKTPGVYLFYGSTSSPQVKKEPIYIGKAINIKERVKNHFLQPSYRDNLFIDKVEKIGFLETDSEIEALILEANLIKKHHPRFNVVWRDDKNYFYVSIAENKEKIPYVYITHQPKLISNTQHLTPHYIGPFVEGNSLKKTLKFLRKVFPYYTSARHPKNKCTWCHLELCPGPRLFEARLASSDSEAANLIAEYKKNVKKLILILRGKRKNVLNLLKKEMKSLSLESKFEEAGKIRDKIYALQKVMAHTRVIEPLKTEDNIWKKTEKTLQGLLDIKSGIERIECYDVSNIQGKSATGSMVVFVNGKPDKSQYKKFKIKMKNEPNDIAMLKEILARRFNHTEWKYPEVMLIDGGIAQLNVAIKAKGKENILIISIAKGRQELFIAASSSGEASLAPKKGREGAKYKVIPLKNLPQEIYNLIKHLDDEAHRFAITYHKKLRKKALLDIS